MSFGGLAPFPLRLTTDQETGLSAECHARLCADLAAVTRTLPALVLTVTLSDTGVSVTGYSGRNGNGLQSAPYVVHSANASYAFCEVDLSAYTNALGFAVDVIGVTGVDYCARAIRTDTGVDAVLQVPSIGRLIIRQAIGSGTVPYRLEICAATDVQIGDYGGHVAKKNCITEGASTYAFSWYRMLKAAPGSGFSQRDDSVRAWTLKAEARALGTSQRISEMLAASSTPHGSDLRLGRWATILGIQQANLSKWQIREQCEAKFADRDPITSAEIDENLRRILGSTFVSATANLGTLTSPPEATYAPGYLNGDAIYDLTGDGVWASSRGRLTITVDQGSYTDDELVDLMTRDVADWLDGALPATSTWEWVTSTSGFILGTSRLGFDSL